jgi:hypothetical protein
MLIRYSYNTDSPFFFLPEYVFALGPQLSRIYFLFLFLILFGVRSRLYPCTIHIEKRLAQFIRRVSVWRTLLRRGHLTVFILTFMCHQCHTCGLMYLFGVFSSFGGPDFVSVVNKGGFPAGDFGVM